MLVLSPYSKTDQPLRCEPVLPIGGPARPVAFEKSPPVVPVETSDMFETRVKPGLLPASSCPPLMRIGAFGRSMSPAPRTTPRQSMVRLLVQSLTFVVPMTLNNPDD